MIWLALFLFLLALLLFWQATRQQKATGLPGGRVVVRLTLTSPACPMGPLILEDARRAVQAAEGVVFPRVDLVWDPPWDPAALPEETRLELGIY